MIQAAALVATVAIPLHVRCERRLYALAGRAPTGCPLF